MLKRPPTGLLFYFIGRGENDAIGEEAAFLSYRTAEFVAFSQAAVGTDHFF